MIRYHAQGMQWKNGAPVSAPEGIDKAEWRRRTIAYQIMEAHSESDEGGVMHIHFDALVSHDITYVRHPDAAETGDRAFQKRIRRHRPCGLPDIYGQKVPERKTALEEI